MACPCEIGGEDIFLSDNDDDDEGVAVLIAVDADIDKPCR